MSTSKPTRPLRTPSSLVPLAPPAPPALSSLPVSAAQCGKALTALCAHLAKREKTKAEGSDLLAGGDEEGEKVFLVVALKKGPAKPRFKPYRIQVPHPVLDARTAPVCLIVADPQRHYKDLLVRQNITFINRVVGLSKLMRGKHKPFEARRALEKSHDVFLADEKIVGRLSEALGRKWLEGPKKPRAVRVRKEEGVKAELERALSGAYLSMGAGTSASICIGSTAHLSAEQLSENALAVIPFLAVLLPPLENPNAGREEAAKLGSWSNVQSLHVKSGGSAALPIWNCPLTADGGRFDEPEVVKKEKAPKEKREKKRGRETKEAEEVQEELVPAVAASEEAEAEVEAPKKKAKKAKVAPEPAAAAVVEAPAKAMKEKKAGKVKSVEKKVKA